jgi:hypothetical protein
MPGHEPTPHYVTTAHGQLRLWRIGQGPDMVVLAGLVLAASETARRLAAILPDWRITVLELPGIGGSAACRGGSLDEVADAVASAIAACDFGPYVLTACDLAVAVAARLPKCLASLPNTIMAIGPAQTLAWAKRRLAPPPLTPRQDGTQLTALWSFIRDCHLLEPTDATQPAQHGDLLSNHSRRDHRCGSGRSGTLYRTLVPWDGGLSAALAGQLSRSGTLCRPTKPSRRCSQTNRYSCLSGHHGRPGWQNLVSVCRHAARPHAFAPRGTRGTAAVGYPDRRRVLRAICTGRASAC